MRVAAAVTLVLSLLLSLPAFGQERREIIAQLCSGDFGAQKTSLENLASAGADQGQTEAQCAREIVAAFEGRKLRCGSDGAVIVEGEAARDAASLQAVEDYTADSYSAPSVNLRLRATAASASAVLTLFTAETAEERSSAVRAIDRRREAVTPALLASVLEIETDAAVTEAVSGLRTQLLLNDPEPANRIAAIEAIAPPSKAFSQMKAFLRFKLRRNRRLNTLIVDCRSESFWRRSIVGPAMQACCFWPHSGWPSSSA